MSFLYCLVWYAHDVNIISTVCKCETCVSEGWYIPVSFKHTLCNSTSIIESRLEVTDSYFPQQESTAVTT